MSTKIQIEDYRILVNKCSDAKSFEIQENTSNNNLLSSQIKYQYNKNKLINPRSSTPQSFCGKKFPRQMFAEPDTSSILKITPQDIQSLLMKLKKNKRSKPKKLCSGACIIA